MKKSILLPTDFHEIYYYVTRLYFWSWWRIWTTTVIENEKNDTAFLHLNTLAAVARKF
jgi:hypothetical protein